MPEFKIKKEKNLEQSLLATPSKRRGAISTLFAAPLSGRNDEDDAKPPSSKLSSPLKLLNTPLHSQAKPANKVKTKKLPANPNHIVSALLAPATHREIAPRNYKIGGVSVASSRPGAHAPPVASSLSSRSISALATPQQTVAPTKTHQNHPILARNNLTRLSRVLRYCNASNPYTRHIAGTAMMEDFEFGGGNETGAGAEMGIATLDGYMGAHDQVPDTVTVPLVDYQHQHTYLQALQNTNLVNQHKLNEQDGVIAELVGFNHNMHSSMHKLEARVAQLEHDVAYFRTLAASNAYPRAHPDSAAIVEDSLLDDDQRSPPPANDIKAVAKTSVKRPVADAFAAGGATTPGRAKYRKKLEVKIPGKASGQPSGAGLPTPMPSTAPPSAVTAKFPTTPRTPYTPGRIGPPDSYKKTTTSINKRDIHNLNKSIPPVNVQLPMVPLTDTEVIVYFFNSLSRPVVSLRLYARGWGPASIVQALNDHREVEPPYLRNTCSVKCTTAIKNGRKLYGDEWEAEHRAVFAEADDCRATDLIRADGDDTVDYYVRALCVNLKQHPTGADAGIFTACVKYCVEHNASYTMGNVYQLAIDLQDGNIPQHPASPAPSEVAPAPQTHEHTRGDDMEDEWTDDEVAGTPSPLAERKTTLIQSGGSIGFIAVNAPHEQNGEDDDE